MPLALAHYDVPNGGQGVDVFVNQEAAIEAVVGWLRESNLVGQSSFQMTEDEARETLRRGEGLAFEAVERYYSVEAKETQGAASEASGVGKQGGNSGEADGSSASGNDVAFDAAGMRKMAALLTPFAGKALGECLDEIGRLQEDLTFYKRRCDALQEWQGRMRDPERTVVCDILANGFTLPPANAGDRYDVKA